MNLKNVNQQGKELFKQQMSEFQSVCDDATKDVGKIVKSALSITKEIAINYKAINKELGYLLPITATLPESADEEGPRPKY